jgi:hypothetical protein
MIKLFEHFIDYESSKDDFNFIETGDTLIAKCNVYISQPHMMCSKKLSYFGEKLFAKKGSKKIAKKGYEGSGNSITLNGFNGSLDNEILAKFFTIKDQDKIETLKNIKKYNL